MKAKKKARQNASKLRVVMKRLPPEHPALSKASIDLQPLPESAQLLPVPATVSHIFADILDNVRRDRVRIQTVSELKFAANDYRDLGTIIKTFSNFQECVPVIKVLNPCTTRNRIKIICVIKFMSLLISFYRANAGWSWKVEDFRGPRVLQLKSLGSGRTQQSPGIAKPQKINSEAGKMNAQWVVVLRAIWVG